MSAAGDDGDLEVLLAYVRDSRGFDFTGYKRGSLTRRILKRMNDVGVESFGAYRDQLEVQPDEFAALFDTILINVTGFYRDREPWEYLAESVLPRVLQAKNDDGPIRLWSAGCASGEEAYSLAMLVCDAVGDERFRTHVKIYGTDADHDALTLARHGRYRATVVEETVSRAQIDRYFERADDGDYIFRNELRRSVIFGVHDVVADPPISRVDLLSCRNTLMYLNADTQRRVLASFHFALNHDGFLLLGKSEALVTRTNLFRTDNLKVHVFQKDGAHDVVRPPLPTFAPRVTPPPPGQLLEAGFDGTPFAQLVIAGDGRLVLANRQARTLFGIGLNQVGRPLKDLAVSYRPVELRSRVDEVASGRRAIVISDVDHPLPGGGVETFEVHLLPLTLARGTAGVSVVFAPMGRFKSLREEAERFQRELETTYEELQSTVEELETTNEELQSTNEELETTNEELHSTNEELETMNEELQSTNEELETMNDELRERSRALDELSSFLQSILDGLGSGVAVLNPQMGVRVWNRQAEDLWGLRSDEVQGQHFLNLDIGLPVDQLGGPIRACLSGQSEGEQQAVDAVNRRGRAIRCAVTISPLFADGDRPSGVIVKMDV